MRQSDLDLCRRRIDCERNHLGLRRELIPGQLGLPGMLQPRVCHLGLGRGKVGLGVVDLRLERPHLRLLLHDRERGAALLPDLGLDHQRIDHREQRHHDRAEHHRALAHRERVEFRGVAQPQFLHEAPLPRGICSENST